MSDQSEQCRIGSDVKRHTEERITAPLVEIKIKLSVNHEGLEKAVARRKRHLRNIFGIPSGNNNPAAVRIPADKIEGIAQLIDRNIPAVRSPPPPLGAIDRPEIAIYPSEFFVVPNKIDKPLHFFFP